MTSNDPPWLRDTSGDTPILERGSYEDAKERLDQMLVEIATAVTAAFPGCPMAPDPEIGYRPRWGLEMVNESEPYALWSQSYLMSCSVSEDRQSADRAKSIVTEIAARYDFQNLRVYNDRIAPDGEGNLSFNMSTPDGDQLDFGSMVYTSVTYKTADRFTAEQLAAFDADPKASPTTPPLEYITSLNTPLPTLTPPAE